MTKRIITDKDLEAFTEFGYRRRRAGISFKGFLAGRKDRATGTWRYACPPCRDHTPLELLRAAQAAGIPIDVLEERDRNEGMRIVLHIQAIAKNPLTEITGDAISDTTAAGPGGGRPEEEGTRC